MKILHLAAECFPLVKTGGLADVVGALAAAQQTLGCEVRICLPAYRGMKTRLQELRPLAACGLRGERFTLCEGRLTPQLPLLWLIECPPLFERGEDPYHDAHGEPWPDNYRRFGLFGEAAAQLASGMAGWAPQVVHLHDWQAGLAAPWIASRSPRPRLMFTVHNLAYQGRYGRSEFDALGLRPEWWHPEALEYYGDWLFMKGGLNFADALTTVSPAYALEIQQAEQGFGLDPVLRRHAARLHGVTNGIDVQVWNPERDAALYATYGLDNVSEGKRANRSALRAELGLPDDERALLVFIGRLAHQKGADLILEAQQELQTLPLQLAVLASGERTLERRFAEWARSAPSTVSVRLGYDEQLAHRMTAAADFLLMPSRYEPCGLTQMYAQRYGTIPIVRRTGGLGDTVVDADARSLAEGRASGVHFLDADAGGIGYGLRRALELWRDPARRRALQHAGMTRDFSWSASAQRYLELYRAMQDS
jgi:starch synthase